MTGLLAAVFLLLQLLCQMLVAGGCQLPSGYLNYPEYNTAVKVHTEKLTWPEARRRCIAEGADLAVVTTPEKISLIRDRSNNDSFITTWTWIGIHRPTGIGGDWVRVDTGLPVTSLPWDDGDDRDEDYNYVSMVYDGTLTNWPGNSDLEFACEISLAGGCPIPAAGTQGSPRRRRSKGDEAGTEAEKGEPEVNETDRWSGFGIGQWVLADAAAPRPRGLTGPTGYCIIVLLYIVHYAVAYV